MLGRWLGRAADGRARELGFSLAIAADEWTRGITFWLRWRSRAWEKQALVEPTTQPAAALGG